jgi:hypothetical protein
LQTAVGVIGVFAVDNQFTIVPSNFNRFAYRRFFLVNVDGNKVAEEFA